MKAETVKVMTGGCRDDRKIKGWSARCGMGGDGCRCEGLEEGGAGNE